MSLLPIYREIAARAEAITGDRPDWPCQRGCDSCCRSLGETPHVTAAEWDLMRAAIADLEPQLQQAIAEGFQALPARGPMTCPLLEQQSGACRIYSDRPAACRSYGFYVSRGQGLYCKTIEARDDRGVVWGNQDALERKLAQLSGPSKPLADWMAAHFPPPAS
jgi:Fe-S-cluster containining protein